MTSFWGVFIKKINKILFLFLFFIYSCEDTADSNNDGKVDSIVLTPVNPLLQPGKSVQFFALVISDKNKELENTSLVWSSSDESIATVDTAGVVLALKQGFSNISAQLGSVSGSSQIIISSIKKRALSEMFTSST